MFNNIADPQKITTFVTPNDTVPESSALIIIYIYSKILIRTKQKAMPAEAPLRNEQPHAAVA